MCKENDTLVSRALADVYVNAQVWRASRNISSRFYAVTSHCPIPRKSFFFSCVYIAVISEGEIVSARSAEIFISISALNYFTTFPREHNDFSY